MKTRNKVLIGGAVVVIAYLLWNKNKKKSNLTATNVSSGAESSTPTNESSNLDLPTGMDLPNLTPSTNVPTEVAIQESINVVPTPAVVESKPVDTETALNNSLIAPIDKDKEAERLLAMQQSLDAYRRAELEKQTLEAQRLAELQRQLTLTTAIPTTAPSISSSVDMELQTPYSQYAKEMIPTYEGGSYQDAERS